MRNLLFICLLGIGGSAVAQNVGIGTNTPKALLDVNGSFGTAITPVTTGTLTLTSSHATVLASPGTTVALPAASGADHRIYNIIFFGTSGAAVTITSPTVNIVLQGGTGSSSLSLTTGSISFQSNGTNWYADVKAPTSNGTGYIQNQTATVQPAGFNISGDGIVGGSMTVGNGAAITGNETLTGSLSVGSTSTLTGNVTATNNLNVGGTTNLTGNVTATNGISVGGSSTLTGTVTNTALAGAGVRFVTVDAAGKLVSGSSTTNGITNANLQNSSITISPGTGLTGGGTVALGGSTTLTLGNVGTAGTYTKVTTDAQGRVTAGTGLAVSDLPTGIGNANLQNSSITINAGTGLTGGGTVALGGSTTLSLPNVGSANTYTKVTTDAQGRVISGTSLAAGDIPAGSGNYIQNTTTQQGSSNFNISGSGVIAGNITAASHLFPPPPGDPSPVITARVVPAGQGASNEKTELIIFHSNDGNNGSGPDLITLRSPAIRLQTYPDAGVGDINNAAGSIDRLTISPDGLTSLTGSLDVAGRTDSRNGLRTKKQYYYFTETIHHTQAPEYGNGSRTSTIGTFDLCSLAAVSTLIDEDDGDQTADTQCNIYPSSLMASFHGDGQRTNSGLMNVTYDVKPTWKMYIEAVGSKDYEEITCSAICINFDY